MIGLQWSALYATANDTTLAAVATMAFASAAALTTDIQMASAATVAVTTAAALTTDITLAAAASVVFSTVADLVVVAPAPAGHWFARRTTFHAPGAA